MQGETFTKASTKKHCFSPSQLDRCAERAATLLFNGQASEVQRLSQVGLPQGSPLSPVLFLFINTDLVLHRIDGAGGLTAFLDDYVA